MKSLQTILGLLRLTCSVIRFEEDLFTAARYCITNFVDSVLPAPLSPLEEDGGRSKDGKGENKEVTNRPDDQTLIALCGSHVGISCTADSEDVSK